VLKIRKTGRSSLFQVLLLDNTDSQNVEVQETEQVDFYTVKQHLRNGGSVFITSKDKQKIAYRKTHPQTNYNQSRKTLGTLFQQQTKRNKMCGVHP
jgi:hypothetical protein